MTRPQIREHLPWSQLTSWVSGLSALDLPEDLLGLLTPDPQGDRTPGGHPTPGALAALAGHQGASIALRLHIRSAVADMRVRLSVTPIGVATLARIEPLAGAPVQGELALVPVDGLAREVERWIPRRPGPSHAGSASAIRVQLLAPARCAREERWVARDGRWCIKEGAGKGTRIVTVGRFQEELLDVLLTQWANAGWRDRD